MQARVGAYTALDAGDTDPALRLTNTVVPVNATFALTQDARWFVKLAASDIDAEASSHGERLSRSATQSALAQLQYRPRPGTLIGLGVTYEKAKVDLEGGGRIEAPGAGLRLDLLQRLGAHAGFAAKVLWTNGTSTATIPLGGGLVLTDKADAPRTYVQLALLGLVQNKDWTVVPEGWSLRPAGRLIFQRKDVADSVNSLGVFEAGGAQDYGEVMVSARLQKDELRPGRIAPFVELGGEAPFRNTAPGPASDPPLAYAKLGAYVRTGRWGFLNAYYAYRDSLDGSFRSGTAEVLLSLAF